MCGSAGRMFAIMADVDDMRNGSAVMRAKRRVRAQAAIVAVRRVLSLTPASSHIGEAIICQE
jgi:hypothetical protein